MLDSLVGSETICCRLYSFAMSHNKVAAAQVYDGDGLEW